MKVRKIPAFSSLILCLVFLASCEFGKDNQSELLSFSIDHPSTSTRINHQSKEIYLFAPESEDLSALKPVATSSANSTVVPKPGTVISLEEFIPYPYTIYAEDGTFSQYLIKVVRTSSFAEMDFVISTPPDENQDFCLKKTTNAYLMNGKVWGETDLDGDGQRHLIRIQSKDNRFDVDKILLDGSPIDNYEIQFEFNQLDFLSNLGNHVSSCFTFDEPHMKASVFLYKKSGFFIYCLTGELRITHYSPENESISGEFALQYNPWAEQEGCSHFRIDLNKLTIGKGAFSNLPLLNEGVFQ